MTEAQVARLGPGTRDDGPAQLRRPEARPASPTRPAAPPDTCPPRPRYRRPPVAARAYALNHQPAQARSALSDADALTDQLPADEQRTPSRPTSEQKHHAHLSHAYTTPPDTSRASERTRAPELPARTGSMTHMLLRIDSATCSHHNGGSEEACRRTVSALPRGRTVTAPAWSTPRAGSV
ncbi:hypothetical protein SAFG77S_12256 [Streptomyces afghaniensis]